MAERVEDEYMELAARMTVAEGTLEAHENRLDGHDETLAVQGRYIDGQQRETTDLSKAVAALQRIADQTSAFFAKLNAGIRIASFAWKWLGRPALAVAGTAVGGASLWIVTHLPAIIHGLDKLASFLSQ